jgi:putative phosphoribosyl transferase
MMLTLSRAFPVSCAPRLMRKRPPVQTCSFSPKRWTARHSWGFARNGEFRRLSHANAEAVHPPSLELESLPWGKPPPQEKEKNQSTLSKRSNMHFQDRSDAGRQLASRLVHYRARPDLLVLALPRGGVPVGFEVARQFGLPLDLFLVRHLLLPGSRVLTMGAVASGGMRVLNQNVVRPLRVPKALIDSVRESEEFQLQRMERIYRGNRPHANVWDKTILLIDDGLAVGGLMPVAIEMLRQAGSARIIVGVPVGPVICCAELEELADELICLHAPEPFHSVARWYHDYPPTSDEEVRELLEKSSKLTSRENGTDRNDSSAWHGGGG